MCGITNTCLPPRNFVLLIATLFPNITQLGDNSEHFLNTSWFEKFFLNPFESFSLFLAKNLHIDKAKLG